MEKQAFFKLDLSEQFRLRAFMVILAIIQILSFVVDPSNSYIAKIIGIGLNVLLLYFSVFITQAPNLYFRLFIAAFIIVVIFNGLAIYQAITSQHLFTLSAFLAILAFVVVVIFAPLIIKHRRYVNDVKKSVNSPA